MQTPIALADFLRRSRKRAGFYVGSMVLTGMGMVLGTRAPGLGVALGAIGGILLFPIVDIYVDVTARHRRASLWALRALVVVAIPVNVVAFAWAGLPKLDPIQAAGFAAGTAGTVGFVVALLRPRGSRA